jgi:hypothetical protein
VLHPYCVFLGTWQAVAVDVCLRLYVCTSASGFKRKLMLLKKFGLRVCICNVFHRLYPILRFLLHCFLHLQPRNLRVPLNYIFSRVRPHGVTRASKKVVRYVPKKEAFLGTNP